MLLVVLFVFVCNTVSGHVCPERCPSQLLHRLTGYHVFRVARMCRICPGVGEFGSEPFYPLGCKLVRSGFCYYVVDLLTNVPIVPHRPWALEEVKLMLLDLTNCGQCPSVVHV